MPGTLIQENNKKESLKTVLSLILIIILIDPKLKIKKLIIIFDYFKIIIYPYYHHFTHQHDKDSVLGMLSNIGTSVDCPDNQQRSKSAENKIR